MHIMAAAAVLFATLARPTPVEVSVPLAPRPVPTEQGRVLAYELHITNFGTTPLVLRRIEIRGADDKPVAALEGAALTRTLLLVGEPMMKTDTAARIEPGRRLVTFLWIPLAAGAEIPSTLRHRLLFDVPDTTDQSVIDGIDVAVHRGPILHLSPPFTSGDWLAGEGPSATSSHRRTIAALFGKTWSSQRYAIDWVRVGPNGDTSHDSRKSNENFWGFGTPVHAVADGEVTEAVDAFPDNPPGSPPTPVTLDNIVGNHVILRLASGEYVLFAHLQSHSIRVRLHDHVKRGEVIALVGNSGNTTGAHLHLEVMDRNSPLGAQGLPFVFDRFTFIGHGRDFEEDHHPVEARRDEMPIDDDVIRFGTSP